MTVPTAPHPTANGFMVYALPRSRTTWLSRFLTYGGWVCGHDEAVRMRSLEDVAAWFSVDRTGSVETSIAPFWRLIHKMAPGLRVATIRRPLDEVVQSCIGAGAPEAARDALTKVLHRHDRKLDQVERRVPGVLRVEYNDLATGDGCARLFEHCLGLPFDTPWWERLDDENIQIDFPWLSRYVGAHRPQIDKLMAVARHTMLRDLALTPASDPAAVVIAEEGFEAFYRDCPDMFERHCVLVGEHPRQFQMKNAALARRLEEMRRLQVILARSNGKVFGYLLTVIGPSLEEDGRLCATHTMFYAAEEFPGLGLKMQRKALALLKARGVDEVFYHAGARGSGPRMGALYRRLGAGELGSIYRIDLKAA